MDVEIIGETDGITDTRKVIIPIHEYDLLLAVVEEAKTIAHMEPTMEAGRHSLWEIRKPDMEPLIATVQELEEIE